jgi:peptidyl-prolyl cis-trans isomerase A (cyclophilin A)
MAKQAGNPNSATSQWFINLRDNVGLNTVEGGYTVFARIVSGMDIVDSIAAMPTFNLIPFLGSAFGTTPAMAPATSNPASLLLIQLVSVTKAYRTEANPALPAYQCSSTSPADTLTEFCGTSLTFPVVVNGVLYEGTLDYIPGRNPLAFAVDKTKLRVLTDTGQVRATFSNGVLTIPSVRNGSAVLTDVRLNLTNSNPLELTLSSYIQR